MAASTLLFAFFLLLVSVNARIFNAQVKTDDQSSFCPKAIFSFADSLSDTGNRNIEANNRTISGSFPYGVTLGFPSGRYCDGWVISDLLNQALKIYPYSIPSLAYSNSFFTGLSFAYAGATVLTVPNEPMSSPHNLSTQVDDFLAHQFRMENLAADLSLSFFPNSLYYIEIGGDDINFHLTDPLIISETIPRVIDGLRNNILRLYQAGARRFLLFNMPRADCAPTYLQAGATSNMIRRDSMGCLTDVHLLIDYFNVQISDMATWLNGNYTDMTVHYFDIQAANTEVLNNLEVYNFKVWDKACCGSGPGDFNCGGTGLCGCGEATSNYTVCDHPETYLTFDGVHYTEQFYRVMTEFLLNGQYVTPPLQLVAGCGVPFTDVPSDLLPVPPFH